VLKCLFYDKPTDNKVAVSQYYYYRFDPEYTAITSAPTDDTETYYVKDVTADGVEFYRLANVAVYGQTTADGKPTKLETYYTRVNRWTLSPLAMSTEDSVYALINEIHTLLGSHIEETRDINSVRGAINTMKDIIHSIDLTLSPGKLLHVSDNGVIETYNDTYFPSASWD
jgi:hypothetical protein